MFDHNPGICARSLAERIPNYNEEQIVYGISKDVVNLIIKNAKAWAQSDFVQPNMSENNDSLANAFNNLAEVLKGQKHSQVTKVKVPPV